MSLRVEAGHGRLRVLGPALQHQGLSYLGLLRAGRKTLECENRMKLMNFVMSVSITETDEKEADDE